MEAYKDLVLDCGKKLYTGNAVETGPITGMVPFQYQRRSKTAAGLPNSA